MEQRIQRRANFSEDETLAMVNAVIPRKRILLGRLDAIFNAAMKKNAWLEVVAEVNLVSRVTRNVEEIRKKFTDFKSAVKKKDLKERYYQSITGKILYLIKICI